ncbi:hypothetical protein F5Y05DRAFT_424644 [Hypoxylon sp. FL0543]|nr:hypothetical protein F5Y05DRAFT_424644 [Hypoxylon sp. FL0543]
MTCNSVTKDAQRRQYCCTYIDGDPPRMQNPHVLNCEFTQKQGGPYAPHINIIPPGHADLCFHCLSGSPVSVKSSLDAFRDLQVSLKFRGLPPEQDPRLRVVFEQAPSYNHREETNPLVISLGEEINRPAPPSLRRSLLPYLRSIQPEEGLRGIEVATERHARVDLVGHRLGLYSFPDPAGQRFAMGLQDGGGALPPSRLFHFELPAEGGPIEVISSFPNLVALLQRLDMRFEVTLFGPYTLTPDDILLRRIMTRRRLRHRMNRRRGSARNTHARRPRSEIPRRRRNSPGDQR